MPVSCKGIVITIHGRNASKSKAASIGETSARPLNVLDSVSTACSNIKRCDKSFFRWAALSMHKNNPMHFNRPWQLMLIARDTVHIKKSVAA